MAAQRYISTTFWDDAWIQQLEPDEKLIYMYLLTNALTNIAGVYEITSRRISFDTRYPLDRVSKALKRFEEDKKAYHFEDSWIILVNWPKHQKVSERSKIREGIDIILKALPDEVWSYLNTVEYQYEFLPEIDRKIYPLDTPSIPLAYGSNYSDSDSDSDIDSDIEIKTSCPNSDESDAPKVDELTFETELAEQMAEIILEHDPQAKTPKSFKTWAKTIDRMIRLDHRTPEQILWLFRWTQNDEFWNGNIRSPDKLRKHWDKLVAQVKRDNNKREKKPVDKLADTFAAIDRLGT